MNPTADIEYLQTIIDAPAEEIYRCFTKGVGFIDWLSNGAKSQPVIGGMLVLWWNSGYYTVGEFTRIEANKLVEFSWLGKGEPVKTQVQVRLTEEKDGVRVDVTHTGLGTEEIWVEPRKEIRRGWEVGLENLKSTLETGKDLRIVNRPGVGIYPADLSLENVEKHQFPVKKGVFIQDTVQGRGAALAGIEKGDLLVSLAGVPINDIEALLRFLARQKVGEHIEVGFYRGAEKKTTELELMRLPIPEVPVDPAAVADHIEAIFKEGISKIRESVVGISDEAASWKPAPSEWSVKETLAHLIHTERDNQSWLHAKVLDDQFEWLNNSTERGLATIAAYPSVESLVECLELSQKETLGFLRNLPAALSSKKSTIWHFAQGFFSADMHIDEHVSQIKQNLQNFAVLQNATTER